MAATSGQLPVTWSNLKGVLFDVDGTLTHSDDLHFKAFTELLLQLGYNGGVPITRAFFDDNIAGRHNPDIAAFLFPEYSADRGAYLLDQKEQLFRDIAASELHRIPGFTELVDIIDAAGLRKIAVTNAPAPNVALMLRCIGLQDYFEDIVYGDQCERAKPFPDPYLVGLKKLGITADEALVFEDSPSGIQAGVAAGIPVIALGTTQDPAKLVGAGASLVVNDYHEVVRLIEEQTKEPVFNGKVPVAV